MSTPGVDDVDDFCQDPSRGWRAWPRVVCTGVAAVWCPIHGDCVCPDRDEYRQRLDGDDCPLHNFSSTHANDGLGEFHASADVEIPEAEA